MKKHKQYEEVYKETTSSSSFPEMYLKEKKRCEEIERRYNVLINMLKEEGCTRVSQKISDELEAQKRLH
jgi:NCAIR mutase (PurE)-related protein